MMINNKDNIVNNIKNLKKIESIIKIWNNIIFLTNPKTKSSVQTIYIPIDTTTPWNDIKNNNNISNDR